MSFTKWGLCLYVLMTISCIVICIFGVPIIEIALAMITGLTTVTSFYMWKAKNENRAKYAQEFIQKFADKYGIEEAIRIADIVLKE